MVDSCTAPARETPDEEDLRYERKFAPDFASLQELQLRLQLHPSLFRSAHPDRWISNVYLDTPDLRCYRDNVEGSTNRAKLRVRWYGALAQAAAQPVLEIKRKHGLVGSKLRYPLLPIDTRDGLSHQQLEELLDNPTIAGFAAERLAGMRPVLVNHYLRSYLLSADGRFRATIDRKLSFHPFPLSRGRERAVKDPRLIVELKYARGDEVVAEALTRELPFRVSRVSKYVIGVDELRASGLGY